MDVVFVVVPFADVARPSIGVSLLKAEIAGLCSASIQYLNLDFAAVIGQPLYHHFCHDVPSDTLAGEWFFADLLFPGQIPPPHEFAKDILIPVTPTEILSGIDGARAARNAFIEQSFERIVSLQPKLVGFTTTFHQTCACLVLAKRLKELPNPPTVVFGGANCEGEMGLQLLRSFPWIDFVCTREGDRVFPQFVERLFRTGEALSMPGLLKQGETHELSFPPLVEYLDELPIPDYGDYFEQLAASSIAAEVSPSLLIETSRGCWWGAKHHCTFCGLNGQTMGFRSKSPQRVIDELVFLRQTYGVTKIDSVDNILDLRYTTEVFPELKRRNLDLEMFYEVKSNLKYQQLKAMYDGGVRCVQPGIESFSDPVLNLMRKGVSGFQNIQLLRWSEEVGIVPAWNILGGFPGESASEYSWTAELIPLLVHLEPPTGCSPIRLDRFSPLFVRSDELGLRRVRPARSYYYVFPLGRRELARLAYFFDFDFQDGRDPNTYLMATQAEVVAWRNARFGEHRPVLDANIRDGGVVHIRDTRACAVAPWHLLSGCDADAYLACDASQSSAGIVRRLRERYSEGKVQASLARLVESKLVATRDGHFVALGIIRNRPADFFEAPPFVPVYASKAANPDSLLRVL
ncbi:MAG: RiPP maturation radical SAM C-methyltransferase [Bryobacteraceae bacterium]